MYGKVGALFPCSSGTYCVCVEGDGGFKLDTSMVSCSLSHKSRHRQLRFSLFHCDDVNNQNLSSLKEVSNSSGPTRESAELPLSQVGGFSCELVDLLGMSRRNQTPRTVKRELHGAGVGLILVLSVTLKQCIRVTTGNQV